MEKTAAEAVKETAKATTSKIKKEKNDIILKLNDQLGILGNNLIQVTSELDYLKQEYKKLLQINQEIRLSKEKKMVLLL